MEGEGGFEDEGQAPQRCPDDCPNAGAPYCPRHEDPSIYRRDENSLHLAEAYANNAARDMVVKAVEHLREKRKLKEVRVPSRKMDEWVVFTKKVVLDSGEYTAQGEVERRVAAWLDTSREQDWDKLDRIKERYMRFTKGAPGVEVKAGAQGEDEKGERKKRRESAVKRPARKASFDPGADAQYFEDEF